MTDLICLTVTKDRPHFLPWLLEVWDWLKWPWGEKSLLVFVDGPLAPYRDAHNACMGPTKWPDVHVYAGSVYTSLGEHRQNALEVACSTAQYAAGLHSTWITWMDDDDWRHPDGVRLPFQSMKCLSHSDQVQLVVPRCERNVLIDVATCRFAETPKQIHWYETLIRADLATKLEPFMPVDISEDYYWHNNAVLEAKCAGPQATHTVPWAGPAYYSSANLFHSQNIACKSFEQAWMNAKHKSDNLDFMPSDFPREALTSLRERLARIA